MTARPASERVSSGSTERMRRQVAVTLMVMTFSKTFASNGGFVAVKERSVKEYLRFYSPTTTFSNAMSPVNAAIVLKAFEIIETDEGQVLRDELMANVVELRRQVREAGLDYYGDPSAIVAVKMGSEGLARLVSRELPDLGLLANLVEYPAVGKGAARFRMQVMAKHTRQNVTDAVQRIVAAKAKAEIALATMDAGRPALRAVA